MSFTFYCIYSKLNLAHQEKKIKDASTRKTNCYLLKIVETALTMAEFSASTGHSY